MGGQVTTLAGNSKPGTANGAGVVARFNWPCTLALDERGRLLVSEVGSELADVVLLGGGGEGGSGGGGGGGGSRPGLGD